MCVNESYDSDSVPSGVSRIRATLCIARGCPASSVYIASSLAFKTLIPADGAMMDSAPKTQSQHCAMALCLWLEREDRLQREDHPQREDRTILPFLGRIEKKGGLRERET